MTIDEFRAAMNAANRDHLLLVVEDAFGAKHIALGIDSGRGLIKCHKSVDLDIETTKLVPNPSQPLSKSNYSDTL